MDARSRQREDIEQAYQIQTKAAVEVCASASSHDILHFTPGMQGAARATAIGLGLAILGHYAWPLFRYTCLPQYNRVI